MFTARSADTLPTMTQTVPAATQRIRVSPVAGYIGAEIAGVDLRDELDELDETTVGELRAALHRHKVIFFRDQEIGHAEQIALARRFGPVTPAHPHEDAPPEGFPEGDVPRGVDGRASELIVGQPFHGS